MEWEKIEDKWALMVYRVRADWALPRARELGNGATLTDRGKDGGESGLGRDATYRPPAITEHAKSHAE